MYALKRVVGAVGLSAALLVAGCATKEDTGRVVGGAAGAAVGSQIGDGRGQVAAIALGTLIGSLLGAEVGARMDREDQAMAARALENNEIRETTSWENPDTGTEWAITPTRTYREGDRPCREFETVIREGENSHVVDGVACRNSDGNWEVIGS